MIALPGFLRVWLFARVCFFITAEFYTQWLLVPSLVGLVLFATQVSAAKFFTPFSPAFSALISLWSTVLLVAWRRRQNDLALRWGVLDFLVRMRCGAARLRP
jgi:hypothetical protein